MLLILLLSIPISACEGGDNAGSESPAAATAADDAAPGREVYRSYCLSCHQSSGGGVPNMYPPLTQTEWVLGDKGRLIRLVLNGVTGRVEVKGQVYNNVMTPHGFLSDQQIADVLTFVRSNFGNDASPVLPQEVAAVRANLEQDEMWEASELEQKTGIPQ